MRKLLIGALSAFALVPGLAQAALVLNLEQGPTTAVNRGSTVPLELFFNEPVAASEAANAFQAVLKITPAGGGVFEESPDSPGDAFADLPQSRTYFGDTIGPNSRTPAFPTASFQTPDRSQIVVSILSASASKNVDVTDNMGLIRVPIDISPNATGPVTVQLVSFSLADAAGNLIPVAPGNVTSVIPVNVVPEPASLGLLAIGGLLTLRRRRVA